MKISVEPWCYYIWALLVVLLPLPWLLSAAAAAAIHELCHWAAVRALGGQVYGLHLGPFGASMDAALFGAGKQALAILAGPAGSLALLSVGTLWPRLAVCGLIQGLFNLLPLPSLDGGRALQLGLERWCPSWAPAIVGTGAWGVCLAVGILCLRLWGKAGLLVIPVLLWQIGRNTSCKRGCFRVQCSCCTQKEGTL